MKLTIATVLIALLLPLAGCGNKGSLVLPPAAPATMPPDTPLISTDEGDTVEASDDGAAVETPPIPSSEHAPPTPSND